MSYPQGPGWGPQQPQQGWGPQQQPGYPPQQGQGWQPAQKPKSKVPVVLAVLGALMGVCCIGGALAPKRDPGAVAPAQAVPSAARQYVQESCSDVVNRFSNGTNLTELQREALWNQNYRGRWVRWAAQVNTVDRGLLGGINVQFKCSSQSLLMDGHASFDASQQSLLMAYTQGASISFEGRLSNWGQLIGISVDDATVIAR